MSEDTNNKEVLSTTLDKKQLEELIGRLSVDSDDEFVGAGQRALHPERAIQFILEKERKLKNQEKSFKILLNQINADIAKLETKLADLLKQRAEILQEISDIEDNMPKNSDGSLNWEEIAAEYDIKPKDGETSDEFKKRAIKELQAKKDNGELDPNSYLAMWLDANNRLNDVDAEIEVVEQELDDLKELKSNSLDQVVIIESIPTEMEVLKEKIENDPENQELLQDLINLEGKIEILEREIKLIENAGEKRYETRNTFADLLNNDSAEFILESAGVSNELLDDFDLSEFSMEDEQPVVEDELLKNPISDPTGGSLTAIVNAAFSPDQLESPTLTVEPETTPIHSFGMGNN